MKKLMMCAMVAFAAFAAWADVITNTVVIVSNIYNNVYHESIVTAKVQNTHFNYYFTNHETVVIHESHLISQTNKTVSLEVGNSYLIAASNQANRAAAAVGDARDFADASAGSASASASSASSAASSASAAAASRSAAASECASALNTINARINWFDEHSGETITQVNITTNIDIQINADEYSYTYKDHNGNLYNNILVHPYRVNGMLTLSPINSGQFVSTAFRAWPQPRTSGYWDFVPAYIDSDINGMRIQYVPREIREIGYSDANGAYPNGKQIPEYFYWQNGYIYMKVNVYVDGQIVGWCISNYRYDNFPTPVNYGTDNGVAMTLQQRSAYGSQSSNLAYLRTLERTSSQGYTIQIPGEPSGSAVPIIDWMRTGPFESDVEDRVASCDSRVSAAEATVAASSAQWSAVRTDWAAFSSEVSNRLDLIASGNPRAYVSPGGTEYPNIIYYERAMENGKVAVKTVGNYYPSLEYRFVPAYGGDASSNYWVFEPAFVDTDVNGLRLHYLPKSAKTITAKTYNAGYQYVPRDFYWQNGVIYVVVDSFNGSTFSGRIRVKYAGTGANEYPNGILNTQTGVTLNTTNYRVMTFDSREGTIMGTGTNITTFYLKTEQGKVMPSYDSVLWIPEKPSISQQPIVDWLAGFVR